MPNGTTGFCMDVCIAWYHVLILLLQRLRLAAFLLMKIKAPICKRSVLNKFLQSLAANPDDPTEILSY